MDLDGWHPDPFGIHEERLIKRGVPTALVKDAGIGSLDDPPPAEPPADAGRPMRQDPVDAAPTLTGPTKTMLVVAALLVAVGALLAVIGIAGSGNTTQSAQTTTTMNPFVAWLKTLPPTTASPLERALRNLPRTTTLTPLELALQALPRAAAPAATSPPSLALPTTLPPTSRLATATTARSSPRPTSAPSHPSPTGATQPAPRPLPSTTTPVVTTTAIPSTTATTAVSQANLAWYLAHGSIFNTLRTDVAKVDQTLATTTQDLSTVHPYWQGLLDDVMTAMALPPIPDDATQSSWTAALGNLSQGATECINGTPSGGTIPATLNQGVSLIATGATQVNDAVASIQALAAASSAAVSGQVQGWYRSHGSSFTTLQTDLSSLSAVFLSTSPSKYSTLAPYWVRLFNDANAASALPPIPDTLAQSYWSTTLDDLVQGAADCIFKAETLPPSLFDQGLALIQSGTTYLGTSIRAVQALAG